ncbi:MAG: radical SAM protein [Planctomycetes bacterium]|nr:radical SAM protein [Planctomycetota bacterium]
MIVLIAGPQKPPRSFQGLGLPYLGGVLEEAGFEVKICDKYPPSPDTDDEAVLDERLAAEIAGMNPSLVGITIHTPMVVERTRLAKCLREHLPDTLLVAGGHHPSAEPEDLLQNSDFDVCVIGEGEETLLEIAQRVEEGQGRERTDWLAKVRGVVYRHEGEIARTEPRPPVADLDSMPVQAHHLLGLEDYGPHPHLGIKSAGLLTYRGCPMGCVFCMNPQGRKVRRRSPSNVVDEMAHVMREFDVSGFNCYDNMFGLNRRHALAVCDEILRRKLDVTWGCWTGGNLVDKELAEKIKASGCGRVGFGVESGDDEVLATARPGFTAAQHLEGIRDLKIAGIKVTPFFMIGLPGESEESVRRTVEFAKRCGADEVCLGIFRPYPGTAVWNDPAAFGARITHGPNYEAYIETEKLSRAAMLECAEWAGEELKRSGSMKVEFLRLDKYAWE